MSLNWVKCMLSKTCHSHLTIVQRMFNFFGCIWGKMWMWICSPCHIMGMQSWWSSEAMSILWFGDIVFERYKTIRRIHSFPAKLINACNPFTGYSSRGRSWVTVILRPLVLFDLVVKMVFHAMSCIQLCPKVFELIQVSNIQLFSKWY